MTLWASEARARMRWWWLAPRCFVSPRERCARAHRRRRQQQHDAYGAHGEAIRKEEVVAAARDAFGAQQANVEAERTQQLAHGGRPLEVQPGEQPERLRVTYDEHARRAPAAAGALVAHGCPQERGECAERPDAEHAERDDHSGSAAAAVDAHLRGRRGGI